MLTRGAASCSRPCGLENPPTNTATHHPNTLTPPHQLPNRHRTAPPRCCQHHTTGLLHPPPFRAMPTQSFCTCLPHTEGLVHIHKSYKKGHIPTPTHRARQVNKTDGNTYIAERGARVTNKPTALDPAAQVPIVLLPARTQLARMGTMHAMKPRPAMNNAHTQHATHSALSFASCIKFMSQSFECR